MHISSHSFGVPVVDLHASSLFIHTPDNVLLQSWVFRGEQRHSIVCADYKLQVGLDVRITGHDIDSSYVGKFRLQVKVWTRGDK